MTVIDEYLKNVSFPQREELERVRKIIKQLVPDAEESISYGMPVFKYNNQYLIWFAAFKDHMSIFPMPSSIEAMGDKLSKFKTSKGTIQFTLDNPIPEPLLKEIILSRLKSVTKS